MGLMGDQSFHSRRSLFSIAPPVCGLNIVWMVVSPGSSHPFTPFVVWYNIVVIRELFFADWTGSVLLNDFPVQQFPHLCH
jgi:hypothetical protein